MSSLYALFQTGSNLVPLLSMCLPLPLFHHLLSVTEKPATITLQRLEASHQGFKGRDERDQRGHTEFSVGATEGVSITIRQVCIFNAWPLFKGIRSDTVKRIYLNGKVSRA